MYLKHNSVLSKAVYSYCGGRTWHCHVSLSHQTFGKQHWITKEEVISISRWNHFGELYAEINTDYTYDAVFHNVLYKKRYFLLADKYKQTNKTKTTSET